MHIKHRLQSLTGLERSDQCKLYAVLQSIGNDARTVWQDTQRSGVACYQLAREDKMCHDQPRINISLK